MSCYLCLKCYYFSERPMILELMDMIILQINADGVSRKFHPGDKLQLWHEELEPQNSLLDILAAGNPDPMVQ
jgi:hypothetical protein